MIKITGTQKQTVKISITEYDLIEATKALIETKFNLMNRFISDEFVSENENWVHGSIITKKVRKATESDIKAYEVMKFLDSIKYDKYND